MKKLFLWSVWFALTLASTFAQSVRVEQLRCEHLRNPIGIGAQQPRLSWKLVSDRNGEVQTAYEIRAASSLSGLQGNHPALWDPGKIVPINPFSLPGAANRSPRAPGFSGRYASGVRTIVVLPGATPPRSSLDCSVPLPNGKANGTRPISHDMTSCSPHWRNHTGSTRDRPPIKPRRLASSSIFRRMRPFEARQSMPQRMASSPSTSTANPPDRAAAAGRRRSTQMSARVWDREKMSSPFRPPL